jgi:hypothetical protein
MRQERADAQFLKLFVGKHQETAMFRLFISFIYTKTKDICQAVFPGTCLWMLIKKQIPAASPYVRVPAKPANSCLPGGVNCGLW